MTSATPQQPELQSAVAEQTALPTWHRPTIDRIDIKLTLIGKGSTADGFGPTFN